MSTIEKGEETRGALPRPKLGLQARLGLQPGERERKGRALGPTPKGEKEEKRTGPEAIGPCGRRK